jgi:hypothetical protein
MALINGQKSSGVKELRGCETLPGHLKKSAVLGQVKGIGRTAA